MIIQGSNNPIVITFKESVSAVSDMSIKLYDYANNELKAWTKNTVSISSDGLVVSCALTQAETVLFPKGRALVEIKLSNGGAIVIYERVYTEIADRNDKKILEV